MSKLQLISIAVMIAGAVFLAVLASPYLPPVVTVPLLAVWCFLAMAGRPGVSATDDKW